VGSCIAALALFVAGCSSDDSNTGGDASSDSSVPDQDGSRGDTGAPPTADSGPDGGGSDSGLPAPDAADATGDDAPDSGDDGGVVEGGSGDTGAGDDAGDGSLGDTGTGDDAGDGSLGDTGTGDDAGDGSLGDTGTGGDAGDGALPDAGDAGGYCPPSNGYDAGSLYGDGGTNASCASNDDCDVNNWCKLPLGSCSGTGVCQPKVLVVPTFGLEPVCGCDGRTYFSFDDAAAHFRNATAGACPDAPQCSSDSDCCATSTGLATAASFCLKPEGQCGGKGICVVPTIASCDEFDGTSQCSCAGDFYVNACYLYAKGLNSKGEPLSGAPDGGFTCAY